MKMNKLVQRLKQTVIVVLERLLASQVLKVHCCCLPTPFDIILRGHTKNYLFEANYSTILLVFTCNCSVHSEQGHVIGKMNN